MKHQLEHNTYCVPKDKDECLNILSIADSLGILDILYSKSVLMGENVWPADAAPDEIGKAISITGDSIYAFALKRDTEIPVEEFIARLKGEWEPAKEVTAPETITLSFNGKEYTYKHVIL